MALQNDPRMFSGGYERINLAPHVALYANLKAREQAREEAYDNYIRNLNKNINPAGMRNQEREVFEDKLRKWQEYGMQNREALRNPRKDNGMASMEFQAGYQDLQNLISESKTREEAKKPVIPKILDPEWRERVGDSFMGAMQSQDLPIYKRGENGQWERDKNSRPIDVSQFEFEPKPFEINPYLKGFDDVKPSSSYEKIISTDPKSMTRKVAKLSEFTQDDYDRIATRAVSTYGANKSFKKEIDKMWNDPNSEDVIKYNETFKNIYGHDMHNPGDLAAAFTIEAKKYEPREEKIENAAFEASMARTKYAQDRMDARQRRAQDFAIARENYRNSKNATIVEEYVKGQYDDPDATPATVRYSDKVYNGKYIKAPKFLVDKYSINEGTEKEPKWNDPTFFMSDDGKYVIPLYKTGKKGASGGSWKEVTKDSRPINMSDWKIQISNDWIKSTRTANELSDEFDVEGDINESGGTYKMQKSTKKAPVYGGIDPQGNVIWKQ